MGNNAKSIPHPQTAAKPCHGPLVEVLDERCRTVALIPETEARRQLLPHRTIALLLYDEAGRVLLRRTASGRDPGHWDTPARGTVRCGESVEEAAVRVLQEISGLQAAPPRRFFVLPPRPENGNERLYAFIVRHSKLPPGAAGPGSEVYGFTAEELTCLLRDFRGLVSPRFLLLAEAMGVTRRA